MTNGGDHSVKDDSHKNSDGGSKQKRQDNRAVDAASDPQEPKKTKTHQTDK